MKIGFFDPLPGHEYLTKMFFNPMVEYHLAGETKYDGIKIALNPDEFKDCIVVTSADNLNPDVVSMLKQNGNKIVGFSCTDSSWVSQCCREAKHLTNIDLMFMLTGIQKVNTGHEMIVNPDFTIGLAQRRFLPDEDWVMFNSMRESGRLQSLPYVHWERQPHVDARPYATRNQQVLIRGGHHMRRFILALKLMDIGKLDCNSGFVTSPYFQDGMNPQFRYCDECRRDGWTYGPVSHGCTNPKASPGSVDLSDLGAWNNKCPKSFLAAASKMNLGCDKLHLLLNARWLTQQQHLEMLARITFTSDLKWLFSIYAAQRFWDAASVGCINLLPSRTADQDYFPKMHAGEHYVVFGERMDWIRSESEISEVDYNNISRNAKALYDDYMRPTNYAIGTPILKHIFQKIEEHTS